MINDAALVGKAEVAFEMGTNRVQFLRGKAEQYEWCGIGQNSILSEVQAALLWSQLEIAQWIYHRRHELWKAYAEKLESLSVAGHFALPFVPLGCEHNAHIFYIRMHKPPQRSALKNHLKALGISTAPHYLPLHSTHAGKELSRFEGELQNVEKASSQLLRLPLFSSMTDSELDEVVEGLKSFYN